MADNSKLNQLLQKIAVEESIENSDIQVKAISSGGANFSSHIYLASITDKTNEKSIKLFAKIAGINEAFRESFTFFQGYDIERFAYSNLFQTYRQLEEKHGISKENQLILPKYYGADSTRLQETIVLEDLDSRGFELYSRFKSVDWAYASSAITELAKYHALSFTHKHENPEEFTKLLDHIQNVVFPDNDDAKASFNHVAQLAINTVHEKNKGKLEKFLNGASMKNFSDLLRVVKHTVLIHGDFRPSNMMYRKRDDGSTEVIPVDYQTIQGGCPAADFVYFIMCGTDGAFRAQYYQPLVDHYYSELGAALARLGLDVAEIYPREDYDFELKQKLPYGLVSSIVGLPILTTPEDQAPKVEEFSLSRGLAVQTGELYRTRLNEIVEDCVAWGVLTE